MLLNNRQIIYIFIFSIIQIYFLSFSTYVLINYNIEDNLTNYFLIYQNVFSSISIIYIILLIYLRKQHKQQYIQLNNNTTNCNIYQIIIYILNIIDILVSLIYIYNINNKYLYPITIFNNKNYIDIYLYNKILISYANLLFNVFFYYITIYCF